MKQKSSGLTTGSSGGAQKLVRQRVVTSVVARSSMRGCKDMPTVSSGKTKGPASEVFGYSSDHWWMPQEQGSNFFSSRDFASGYLVSLRGFFWLVGWFFGWILVWFVGFFFKCRQA